MAKGKSNPKTLEAVKRATKQARQADAASGGGAAPSEPTSSRPPPPSDARGGSGGKSRKSARGRRGARSDSDDDEEAAAAAAAAASAAREAKRGGATGTGSSARVQLGGFGIGCRGTGNEKARKLREEHDEAVRRKKATRKKEAEARAAREAAAGSLNQLAADEEEAAWRVRNPTRNARANRSKKDRGGGGGGGGGRGGRVDDEDEDDDVGAGVLARSALADLEETEEEDGDGEEAGRGVGGAGAGGFSLLRGSDDDDDEEEEEDEEDEEDPEPEPEPEPESVIEVEDAPAEDLEDVLVEDVPDEEPPPPPPPPPPEEAADAAAAAADDSESSAWETESDDDGAAPWEPRLRESLFDGVVSASFEENLDRMRVEHGFVPPYRRNLIDPEGLVSYLQRKLYRERRCVFCDRVFGTLEGVRGHMRDKQHVRIKFEPLSASELELFAEDYAPEYSEFYDFASNDTAAAVVVPSDYTAVGSTASLAGLELVTRSGKQIGHRNFRRYYKQRFRNDYVAKGASNRERERAVSVAVRLATRERNKQRNEVLARSMRIERRGMSKAIASQFAFKAGAADNAARRAIVHHWGAGGGGSHYHNSGSKQFLKGVRVKGVVSRHSKQGAKMQAARVQAARNRSNRGNASVAVLRSSTRKG